MGIPTQGSLPGQVNSSDLQKWLKNTLVFLAPLALIYLGSVLSILQTPNHVFSWSDLVPSTMTKGAIMLYVFNSAYDFVRKFIGNTTNNP